MAEAGRELLAAKRRPQESVVKKQKHAGVSVCVQMRSKRIGSTSTNAPNNATVASTARIIFFSQRAMPDRGGLTADIVPHSRKMGNGNLWETGRQWQ